MEFKSGPIKLQVGAQAAPKPRDLQADQAQLQSIQVKLSAGDLEGAAELAQAALAGGLEHPLTFNLAAGMLEADDRFAESVALLQRGHRAFPQDLGIIQALGLGLFRLQRFSEALPHFDAMTAAQPGFAQAHAARGAVLEALGHSQDAEAAYRRALELQGDNLLAMAGVAGLASRAGNHADARRFAEQVLAAEPGYPDAVMALARADLAEGHYDAGEARLAAMIDDPRVADPQRETGRELLEAFAAARTRKFDA